MAEDLAYRCSTCPKAVRNSRLSRLLWVLGMQDGGAPVPFHYLNEYEWHWLAAIRDVRAELTAEEMKRRNAEQRS